MPDKDNRKLDSKGAKDYLQGYGERYYGGFNQVPDGYSYRSSSQANRNAKQMRPGSDYSSEQISEYLREMAGVFERIHQNYVSELKRLRSEGRLQADDSEIESIARQAEPSETWGLHGDMYDRQGLPKHEYGAATGRDYTLKNALDDSQARAEGGKGQLEQTAVSPGIVNAVKQRYPGIQE